MNGDFKQSDGGVVALDTNTTVQAMSDTTIATDGTTSGVTDASTSTPNTDAANAQNSTNTNSTVTSDSTSAGASAAAAAANASQNNGSAGSDLPPASAGVTLVRQKSAVGLIFKPRKQRADGSQEEDMCPVCACELQLPFRTEVCKHTFCYLCLKNVIEHAQRRFGKPTCPLCRTELDGASLMNAQVEADVYLEELKSDDHEYVWQYGGRGQGAWLYDAETNKVLEDAYKAWEAARKVYQQRQQQYLQEQMQKRQERLKQKELENQKKKQQQQQQQQQQATGGSMPTSADPESKSVDASAGDVATDASQVSQDATTLLGSKRSASDASASGASTGDADEGESNKRTRIGGSDGADATPGSDSQTATTSVDTTDATGQPRSTNATDDEDVEETDHYSDHEEDGSDYDFGDEEDGFDEDEDEDNDLDDASDSAPKPPKNTYDFTIGAATYTIDFVRMVQYPKLNPYKTRPVYRVRKDSLDITAPGVKGVSGIKFKK